MKRKLFVTFLLTCMPIFFSKADAQIFSDSSWDQKTVIMGKYSPLFYEPNVGANVSPDNYSADFIYFGIGYGKPSSSNEWRKFLSQQQQAETPPQQPSQPTQPSGPSSGNDGNTLQQPSQPSAPSAPEGSMSGLHSGMIALGWQHFFNHIIGFHVQAGWGFIADFGSGDENSSKMQSNSSSSDKEEGGKKTFIYNGVPTQVGIDINLWENLTLQVGATYMWKESPYITVGIGVTF